MLQTDLRRPRCKDAFIAFIWLCLKRDHIRTVYGVLDTGR